MSRSCPFHKIEIPEATQECPACVLDARTAYVPKDKIRALIEELESEIGGNRENEYEAGCSSGRQRAITALEALL